MLINKPRKPWLAALLTFFTLGLGHIYGGKAKKGIILFFIGFLASLITLPLWLPKFFPTNYIVLFAIGLAYLLYCLVDAIKIARESKYDYTLQSYNRWYVYLAVYLLNAVVFSTILSFTVRSYVTQAFKIPAGSMMPTLLIGDCLLTDKHIFVNHAPQRGDVVIFSYPLNPSQNFIKRVIGIEGDMIEIKDKQLYLNNSFYEESYVTHLNDHVMPADISPRDNFGPVTVPRGALFLLGDNRDNSHDSRFWGFVDKEKVIGKAEVLYWSWDKEKSEVRWDRINKRIN